MKAAFLIGTIVTAATFGTSLAGAELDAGKSESGQQGTEHESPGKASSESADVLGWWKWQDETDQTLYAHIEKGHRVSTIYAGSGIEAYGKQGEWRMEGRNVTIRYRSGWKLTLAYKDGRYVKRAYAPDRQPGEAADHTSTAIRVEAEEVAVHGQPDDSLFFSGRSYMFTSSPF